MTAEKTKAGKPFFSRPFFTFRTDWDLVMFAIKLTIASLAALAIAFWANLPEPYWASVTVAVLANPNADQVTTKSIARVFGTVAGAVFAVLLIGVFEQERVLFIAALCVLLGACAWLSMWFRDTEAYAFELAGYTAAIIAVEAASAPEQIFSMATGRVSEVFVGIGVTWLVSLVMFPKYGHLQFPEKVRKAGEKLPSCLAPGPAGAGARVQFANVLTVLHGFGRRMPMGQRGGRRHVMSVRSIYIALLRALFLSSALSSPERRREDMDALVSALPTALASEQEAAKAQAQWEEAIARLEEKVRGVARHAGQSDTTVLWLRFATQCRQFLIGYRALFNPEVEPIPVRGRFHLADADGLLASIAAFQTMTSVAILSWFWLATGWESGFGAVVIAAVYTLRLAPKLHAMGAYRMMLWVTLICTVPSLVLTFQLIPFATDFPILAVALTPYFFAAFMVGGLGGPYAPMSILIVLVLTVIWQPENSMTYYAFGEALGGVLSIFAGFFLSAIVNIVVLPTSPWPLRLRLLRAACRSLRRATSDGVDDANKAETRLAYLASEIAPEFHAKPEPFRETDAAFVTGLATIALARLHERVETDDPWHDDVRMLQQKARRLELVGWRTELEELMDIAARGGEKARAAIHADSDGKACQAAASFEVLRQSLAVLAPITVRPQPYLAPAPQMAAKAC